MRIVRRIVVVVVAFVVALLLAITVAAVVFDAVTSDPNVPVRQLWHGPFVRADGVLTAYREWGAHGTPIVLVGGAVEPSFVWDEVGPILARTHRVFALDLDGFGYTERHGPWNLREWTDQTEGFARRLHLRDPIVVGHSLGAAVAVELARRHVASRIVLLDGDALSIAGPPSWIRSALVGSPYFTAAFRIATRSHWIVRRVLANAWGPTHPRFTSADLSRWTDQFRAANARQALAGMFRQGLAGVTAAELRATHTSATVVWGADDDVDSRSAGEQTARDLHAPFVLVPGAGHLSMLARPAAVARAIERVR